MPRLSVRVGPLALRNPTMLASGILGETGASMRRAMAGGAGAVVTKSIGSSPRAGYANPTVVEYSAGMLNAMGLPNPGVEEYADEIRVAKGGRRPIIGSIFGGSAEEFAALASKMASFGVDALELNLSCPHAKGYGTELGADPAEVEAVCRKVKGTAALPVFAKLTPNTSDVVALGLAAERGGADGVVAINTLRAMAISPELRRPILANTYGGLSGPAIRPVGVRCVFELYEALRIPIIGVGGIGSAHDALEYILAGAHAVQIGTAVREHGPEIFGNVCEGLERFLRAERVRSIEELVGGAHGR